MPTFLENHTDVMFTGYDIVEKNIENHRNKFLDHKNWSFERHDLVTDPIKTKFDLILSRHTFQHLKTSDVKKIIKNFINSGSGFLLATNYPSISVKIKISFNSEFKFEQNLPCRQTLSYQRTLNTVTVLSTCTLILTTFLLQYVTQMILRNMK